MATTNTTPTPVEKLRGLLLLKGMTLRDFAVKHGFGYSCVRATVTRHWGTDSCPKQDTEARRIIEALTKEVLN
jgi:histidinol-phosphate/aromatic aminotransferase/cobyric acid decarboxylase-like protein